MAYSVVPTVITGDSWTAGNQNTYVRDNFKAGIPDIFNAAGDIAYGTAANAAGVLPIGNPREILYVNEAGTTPEWSSRMDIGCVLTGTTVDQVEQKWPTSGGFVSYYKVNFSTLEFGTADYWNITNPDAVIIPEDGVYQLSGQWDNYSSTSAPAAFDDCWLLLGPQEDDLFPRYIISVGAAWLVNYVNVGETIQRVSFCYTNKFTSGDDIFLGVNRSANFKDKLNVRYSIRRLRGLG